MEKAVEMCRHRQLRAWLHGSRSHARRIAAVGAFVVLLSAVLPSCGQRTGPSAVGPPTSLPTSPTVTATSSIPTPSVTPASWRRIVVPSFLGGSAVWDGKEVLVVHSGSTWDKKANVERCYERAAGYNPSTNSWRNLPPVPRITAKECEFGSSDDVLWTGTEMLLWGATNSAYDPTTNSWRRVTDPPMRELSPQVVVWTGRQMIGWGTLDCCDIAGTDGVAFNPATGVTTRLPYSPLSGGGGPSAVWTGQEMIVAGGGVPEASPAVIYSEAAAYHPATRTWSTLPPMPISRMGGTALWDGDEVLILGGWGGANTEREPKAGPSHVLARGVAYDPSTNRWRWLAAPAFPRDGAVYAWDGREVLMWGGLGLDGRVPPHGEAYDPATDTWSSLPRAPLRGRVDADSVWTGTELIIWGGIDARTATPDGSWKPLSDGAAFTPASPSG